MTPASMAPQIIHLETGDERDRLHAEMLQQDVVARLDEETAA